MNEWADKYFTHLTVRNYAAETIASRKYCLKPFLAYLRSQGVQEPHSVTPEIIRNYQTYLFEQMNAQGKQNHVNYRNHVLFVAKSFLKFLKEQGVIAEDPGIDVEFAIEPKRLPRYVLTETEIKKLLDAPDKTTVLGYRDKTILEVFYSSGIRRSELINLRLNDVDLDGEVLRINSGKGDKDRVVPIGKIACRYLKHYIHQVRSFLVQDPTNDHLFLSREGNRISKCMLGLRLKEYAKKAGIVKNISPHTLRATCATHCIQGKKRKEQMHPRYLMELLGHNSMEALNPYLSVSIVDLKEAHSRCHPREREKKVI